MFKCIKCGGYCEDLKIAMITGLCVSCWEDSKKEKKPVKDNPIKKVEVEDGK